MVNSGIVHGEMDLINAGYNYEYKITAQAKSNKNIITVSPPNSWLVCFIRVGKYVIKIADCLISYAYVCVL